MPLTGPQYTGRMISLRNRTTVPVALALAVVLAPALAGCSGNPIGGIIEGATGGAVQSGTEIPKGFPSEVPIIDGEITFGGSVGDDTSRVYNVTVKVDGLEAYVDIKAELEGAGFTSAVAGTAGEGGTGAFSNDKWGVLVVVTEDGSKGFLANYTVTAAEASN